MEHLSVLDRGGAVITCNHFSAYDNYILFNPIRGHIRNQRLYKVIPGRGITPTFPGCTGFCSGIATRCPSPPIPAP